MLKTDPNLLEADALTILKDEWAKLKNGAKDKFRVASIMD